MYSLVDVIQFPPDIEIGDGEGIDMQLPNNVYNSLKRHSMSESKRGLKHSEKKEHSTAVCLCVCVTYTHCVHTSMVVSAFMTGVFHELTHMHETCQKFLMAYICYV